MRKEYDFTQGKRGPVAPLAPGKTRITIRLDSDIVAWFRDEVNEKGGGNYQTMINDALRSYIGRQDDLLAEMRRVIRESAAARDRKTELPSLRSITTRQKCKTYTPLPSLP